MKAQRYLFTLLLSAITVFTVSAQKTVYNILFIQAYTPSENFSKKMEEGLRKGFKDESVDVNITTEYLNSRFWNWASDEEFMRRICQRAADRGTDLIVTANDEAFYCLLACGDALPKKVPIVFFGVNFPDDETMEAFDNITGFTYEQDYQKLFETAKYVFPERTNVILISEDTLLGWYGVKGFKEKWAAFVEQNPEYTYKEFNASKDAMHDILFEVQLAPETPKSIVVYPFWGTFTSSIAKVSQAPSFTLHNLSLQNGAFCAVVPDPYKDARLAAQRASLVLKGESPSALGITENKADLTFDYKQLKFFNVSTGQLPKDSEVINKPYLERHGVLIMVVYALIVGLLIFIVIWLFRLNRRESVRRIHAQTKLLVQSRMVAQRDEFDHVFHSIRDGVITYDSDLRIHFINYSVLQILHLPLNETSRPYEGKAAGTICRLYNNGEEILIPMLERVNEEGISLEIPENTFMKEMHSDNYFPVSGEIVPIRSHGIQKGVAFTFRNISDEAFQKRIFNLALEESAIYPWQYNIHTNSFVFPASYTNTMGFSGTSISRKEVESRIHPEDWLETTALFNKSLDGNNQNTRLSFRQKNGSGIYEWWEFRITMFDGINKDQPYHVMGVCQSIQRYKNAEQELIAARDSALQADRLKTAFLANMSHEIRTPLNAIVGFSDLLKDIHLFSEYDVQQFVGTINKNCELLLALISDILDLSRIESGTMEFQFSTYYLPILMQEVYDSQRLNMPGNVMLIKQVPDGSEKTIITDSVRLKQVLNNLINNAAKFTTTGSIIFGYEEYEPGYITFFVEDTGAGISVEEQKRIFERFYKVDSFTQGAGLGLSICQTIVNRLNGTIGLKSEKGKGTRFTVRIPLVQ